jgi:hypothetical protein
MIGLTAGKPARKVGAGCHQDERIPMTPEKQPPQEDDELVEDLDVAEEDAGAVKGGMSPDEIKEKMMKDPGSK